MHFCGSLLGCERSLFGRKPSLFGSAEFPAFRAGKTPYHLEALMNKIETFRRRTEKIPCRREFSSGTDDRNTRPQAAG